MRRVLVAGSSGAGKTTLARRLQATLGLAHHELDALHHGPGWVKRASFEAEVAAFAATDEWVSEEQYSRLLGELLWERADTVVWLDYPRPLVLARVLRRSLARAIGRRELWHGNRESWRDWVRSDHPIRWSWTHFAAQRRDTAERIARHPALTVHRFRRPHQTRRWLRSLVPPPR